MSEHTCKHCGREFNSETALQQHSGAKHSSASPRVQVKKKTAVLVILLAIAVVLAIVAYRQFFPTTDYTGFAKCISDSGTKFYGTFWCPHCINQRQMFGSAKEYLPYIECSTPDGKGQLQVCKDAGIKGYPTWIFGDGSMLSGEVTLDKLAEKTGCALP